MDKRLQLLYTGIIFCLAFSAFGQAPVVTPPVKKTTDSVFTAKDRYGNVRYSLSESKFVEMYVAQRNLAEVGKQLTILRSQYNTLIRKDSLVEAKYKAEINSLLKIRELLEKDLSSCKKTASVLDKEAFDMAETNKKLKKNQKVIYGLGVATPIVITIAVFVIKSIYFK
jgi:hypothetical protein